MSDSITLEKQEKPLLSPATVRLFFHPKDRLRLTSEDRSWIDVKPAWASPLARPGRFLSLLDSKGSEILMIDDPDTLTGESRAAVEDELKRRYLTSTVKRILGAKVEFGATYWHVLTERGERDFVTQSLQENAQWLGDHHLLLIDVDGNRFEIQDTTALDIESQHTIERIL